MRPVRYTLDASRGGQLLTVGTQLARRKSRQRLIRILGLGVGLAVVFGSTVGTGILRLPGMVAQQLGAAWLIVGVWLAGGVYSLLAASSVAELAAMLPQAGGFYVYARRAFGAAIGFMVGWGDWINNCAALAMGSAAAAEYFALLVPRMSGHERALAWALIAGLTLLHWVGLRLSSFVLQLSSSLTGLTLVGLALACLLHGGGAGSALHTPLPAAPTRLLPIFAALVVALRAVVVTYDGWYEAIYFAEEDKNPGNNLPKSILGGVVVVTLLYLLINLAFLTIMPMQQLAASKLPAADAAQVVFASTAVARWSAQFVTLISMLTLVSLVNAVMLGAPRILFAVARDGLFPELVSDVSATGSPRPALLLSSLAAALLVATGSLERIVAIGSFSVAAVYCMNYFALFVLRRREPHVPRPFRAWGYPWSTMLVLAGSLLFLLAAIREDLPDALGALLLLAASAPVYRLMRQLRLSSS